MSLLEWVATIGSLIYLYYAIKNNAICFVFGIIGSLIWAYVSFFSYHLVFDAALQIFYVVMSAYGIYEWLYGGEGDGEKPITKIDIKSHALWISGGIVVSCLLIYLSKYIEQISYAGLDAFTTVFLVIGTILLVRRNLSSWIYLVVADIVYIYVYGKVGAWLFVGMMIVYVIFGSLGYLNWKKIYQTQASGR